MIAIKTCVLGTGAYGIALALALNKNSHDIIMWTKFEEEKTVLEQTRRNDSKLPNVVIPDNIKFTTNLQKATKDADLIIIAVPAGAVEEISINLQKYYLNQHIC